VSRTYPKAAEIDAQAAERERMRAITRELHEAAQDARTAARELRAERAAAAAAAAVDAGRLTALATEAIDKHVSKRGLELAQLQQTIIDTLNSMYEGFLERLGELADTEMDQEGIETFMAAAVLRATRTAEFVARVVEAVAEEIKADPALCTPAPRGAGRVYVGTADAIQAFVRAGGDPGVVLDART
jgi:hypothetical protein